MHILPREHEKLLLHQAGFLAQKRLARGLQLNINEAIALIASQLQERIRDGQHSVAELMQHGKTLLGRTHVLPSVPPRLHEIQVEGTFPDGVFLVTVHDPICTDHGDLDAALYGSFLPVPTQDKFPTVETTIIFRENLPGAIIAKKERIIINKGRERIKLKVTNHGDRPIQVRRFPNLPCPLSFSKRWDLITISPKLMARWNSIASKPTGCVLIFPLALLFASSPVIPRPLHYVLLGARRP